ncbi:MAG: Rib/alpha-like domain-containing protein, partial [Peptoniphilus lacrimalis]|uniref:Rib/alpha-like domain-containing protein n=1 Tax=Peptoniphilus lacrimalis TaxID=33031 RepID=UPI00254DD46C
MKTYRKRFMASTLALLMTVSIPLSALAEGNTESENNGLEISQELNGQPVSEPAPASEADSFTPVTTTLEVVKGKTVDITRGLTNAPAGATVAVKTNVDTSTVGSQTGVITVTFSDSSTKEVNITVNVKAPASEADSFTPVTTTLEVVKGKTVDIT